MEIVTEQEIDMMIEMGDKSNKGGVDLEDFIELMKEMELIPIKEEKNKKKEEEEKEKA